MGGGGEGGREGGKRGRGTLIFYFTRRGAYLLIFLMTGAHPYTLPPPAANTLAVYLTLIKIQRVQHTFLRGTSVL